MVIRISLERSLCASLAKAVQDCVTRARQELMLRIAGRDIWIINADIQSNRAAGLSVHARTCEFHGLNSTFEAGLLIGPCLYSSLSPLPSEPRIVSAA
jgi:hypothetical protein